MLGEQGSGRIVHLELKSLRRRRVAEGKDARDPNRPPWLITHHIPTEWTRLRLAFGRADAAVLLATWPDHPSRVSTLCARHGLPASRILAYMHYQAIPRLSFNPIGDISKAAGPSPLIRS